VPTFLAPNGDMTLVGLLTDAVRSDRWEGPASVLELASRIVSIDCETHLIQKGLLAPPLVCGSIAWFDPVEKEIRTKRLSRDEYRVTFRELIADPDVTLALANAPFDMLVAAEDAARPRSSPGRAAPPPEDLLPQIFAAYEAGRIIDVQVLQQLHAIARGHLNREPDTGRGMVGRYSLSTCVRHVLGREDAKRNDRWRLRYYELEDVPMSEWPSDALEYLDDDARNALEVVLAQLGAIPKVEYSHRWSVENQECVACRSRTYRSLCNRCETHDNAHAIHDQVYTHWCMHLGAAWGFRVDQVRVAALMDKIRAERADGEARFRAAGFIRPDGTKDTGRINRAVAEAYDAVGMCSTCSGTGRAPSPKTGNMINCAACGATGLDMSRAPDVPRTPADRISRARDVLDESGDDDLIEFANYGRLAKGEETYGPYLMSPRRCEACGGAGVPKDPHRPACQAILEGYSPTYKPIPLVLKPNPMLESDRTSYGDMIQQFPRVGGYRECIVARPDYGMSSTDYNQGELVTLSEACLTIVGESELAKVLNADQDPHKALGAQMLGLTYEEIEARIKDHKHPGHKQAKDGRQAAKPPNFGFGGGMGAAKLVITQRRQGPDTPCPAGPAIIGKDKKTGAPIRGYRGLRFCILVDGAERCGVVKLKEWKRREISPACAHCLEVSERIREQWFARWVEMKAFHRHATIVADRGEEDGDPGQMIMLDSRIVRGGVNFNACANGYFQSLLARAAKRALRWYQRECCDRTHRIPRDERGGWRAAVGPDGKTRMVWDWERASRYAGGQSPLLGSRVVAFQHDETLAEHPRSIMSDAALRGSEIMVRSLRLACPSMRPACKAPPALMSSWYKGAEPVWKRGGAEPADDSDSLIFWEPSS
jgi:DNA polymerase-1